jgi:acetoin utilization protein AcuB
MRLGEIMTNDVATVTPRMGANQALETMHAKRVRHLVVRERGAVVGVISERDLGGAMGAGARATRTVGDLMTAKPITMKPRNTVRQAANRMRGRSIGCVPIVEEGRLLGIVTVSDLLELLGRGVTHATQGGTREALRTRGRRE